MISRWECSKPAANATTRCKRRITGLLVRSILVRILPLLVICAGLLYGAGFLRDASAQDLPSDLQSDQELWKAVAGKNVAEVWILLPGVDVNARNEAGATLLTEALSSHNGTLADTTQIVNLLLARGADVNAQDRWGNSVLMYAVDHRSASLVKTLINNGANVWMKNHEGETALHEATRIGPGLYEIVKLLVEAHARVEERDVHGVTALMLAARSTDVATVKYLLAHHANVNARDKDGMTVLMHALFFQSEVSADWQAREAEVIRELLRQGAKVNARMNDGRTALTWAIIAGNEDMVRLLLRHGANINARDWKGSTPLDYCRIAAVPDSKMVALLRTHGGHYGTGRL